MELTRPATIESWAAADRRLDLDRMRQQLADDVVLVSPLTDRFRFTGPDDVMAVFASAFALLADIEIAGVTGAGRDWVLHGSNTIDGANLEEIQWLHLDDAGLIDRITCSSGPRPRSSPSSPGSVRSWPVVACSRLLPAWPPPGCGRWPSGCAWWRNT